MNRTITVEVTAEDIEAGMPSNSSCCPVALAMLRALGDEAEQSVTAGFAFLHWGTADKSVPTPPDVLQWMDYFDQDYPVAPFTFTLELPPT